jgi:hypothetical protein
MSVMISSLSSFLIQIVYVFLMSPPPLHAQFPVQPILLKSGGYKPFNFIHPSVTSIIFGPYLSQYIFLKFYESV